MIIFDTSMMKGYVSAAKSAADKLHDASADLKRITDHSLWTCPEKVRIDESIMACKKSISSLYQDINKYCDAVETGLNSFEEKQSFLSKLFEKVVETIKKWVSTTGHGVSGLTSQILKWLLSIFSGNPDDDNEVITFPDIEGPIFLPNPSRVELDVINCKNQYKDLLMFFGISDDFLTQMRTDSANNEEFLQKLENYLTANSNHEFANNYPDDVWYELSDGSWGGQYVKGGCCTWYAFCRYKETHGRTPKAAGPGGRHGGYIDEMLRGNDFDVYSTSEVDYSKITNGFACTKSAKGQSSDAEHGHVVYIEGVVGNTVYITEGLRDPYSGRIYSYVRAVPIETFKQNYDTVVVGK